MLREVGKKIKAAREEVNVSQRDLGVALGLSDKAVSAYEAGRTIPPLETLARIAKELQKPLPYFLDESDADFKMETSIVRMEQDIARFLKEIENIRKQMGLKPLEEAESASPKQKSTSKASPKPKKKKK